MTHSLHPYYLSEMGIERWKLRPKSPCQAHMIRLLDEASVCTRCHLHQGRKQMPFASGNPSASVMIIADFPEPHHNDDRGIFIGKSGILWNHMLKSVGFSEEDVYMTTVLKCNASNELSKEDPIKQCSYFLKEQIAAVAPKVILGLGALMTQWLQQELTEVYCTTSPLNQFSDAESLAKNSLYHYQGIPVVVSFHPSYLLSHPHEKRKAYQDMLSVKQCIDQPILNLNRLS